MVLLCAGFLRGTAQEHGPGPCEKGTDASTQGCGAYVSLEHRSLDAMTPEDRELWSSRTRDIAQAAAIHGYNIEGTAASGNPEWMVSQSLCLHCGDTLLLQYRLIHADRAVSAFTVLVPRSGGPVRVVSVLHHNAWDFLPSIQSPGSFALFDTWLPEEERRRALEQRAAAPWLGLGLDYAELTGNRPIVPIEPSLDNATILAPEVILQIDDIRLKRELIFSDREGPEAYRVWNIRMDRNGKILQVKTRAHAAYTAHLLPTAAPAGKLIQPTEQPQGKSIPDVAP
ncbi:hypothetical protein GCM10011586_28230 [Silvibacterium dinghuense]|nr:hypothetical protein GCM10011586_28230 [Silvibacterium dinghuense]